MDVPNKFGGSKAYQDRFPEPYENIRV